MNHERNPEVLLARIDRLERRLAGVTRTLSVAGALLILVVTAMLVSHRVAASPAGGGAAPGEIVATSVKLVDATGRPRAALYVDGQVAGLALSDPAGRTRLLLNTDGESTRLSIVGTKQGFPRINLVQQGDVQLLNLEDNASFIGLTHSGATPSIVVSSQDTSAELGITESFAARQPKPTVGPSLALKQGGRTIASLPAAPAPPR